MTVRHGAEGGSGLQEASPGTIRVLVVDDHVVFAELLSMALDSEPDLACVGHAQTVSEAIRLADLLQPDLVTMDVQLPDGDGITATSTLRARHPELRVVILTAHAEQHLVSRAADAGASGILPKDGSVADILAAVRSARSGSLIVPPGLLTRWQPTSPEAQPAGARLTPREREVLELLARGRDPRAISRHMGVTLNTSRGHIKSVLAKLQVHSQLEAVVVASQAGLITMGDTA
jgi:DNA-binding NarL/FixJ family response regulator